jgi:Glycosyl transferase 4-like domain
VDPARSASNPAPDGRRVLIVSQATVDGVAVCVRDLAEAAVDRGYDLTVACPSAGDLARWVQERGAAWERLEMRRSPHPSDVLAVARVRRLARASDLVHWQRLGARPVSDPAAPPRSAMEKKAD